MSQLLSLVGVVILFSVAILVAVYVRERRRVRRIVALLHAAADESMPLEEAQVHLHGEIAAVLFVDLGKVMVDLRRRGNALVAEVFYLGDASTTRLVDIVVLEKSVRRELGAGVSFRVAVNPVLGGRA